MFSKFPNIYINTTVVDKTENTAQIKNETQKKISR